MQSIMEVGGVDLHMLTTMASIDICGSDSQSSSSQNASSISASGTTSSDCSLTSWRWSSLAPEAEGITNKQSWPKAESAHEPA